MIRSHHIYLAIFFFFILAINIASLWHNSTTYDENSHLRYGLSIARLDSSRFDDSKMPFSFLNALPYKLLDSFHLKLSKKLDRLLVNPLNLGRMVTVLFSLVVAFIIYCWTRDLYGPRSALFALGLYAFEPNIIAHSQLITTDLYSVGMTTLATYSFWIFLNTGTRRSALVSAFFLGLSQLSKYTCVYLYPIFLMIVVIRYGSPLLALAREGKWRETLRDYLAPFCMTSLQFIIVSILVINAGFLFNGSFTPLKDYRFKSELFQTVQSDLSSIGILRVPFPYPFVEGLDFVKFRERTGDGYGNIYLMGELREKGPAFKGFKSYYLYASLFKMPVALQVFIVLAIIRHARRFSFKNFRENELFLFLPVLFFTIYFNLFFNAQIGLRHYLVVFPFLIIFAASLVSEWDSFPIKSKAAIAALSAYLVISTISFFPHFIPYVNEFAGDRKMAYRLLADSNLDWGQSEWYLSKYLGVHPGSIVNPGAPVPGKVIVNVNSLLGITTRPEQYQWLRENFVPIDHVAYSYLVFDIAPDALTKLVSHIHALNAGIFPRPLYNLSLL